MKTSIKRCSTAALGLALLGLAGAMPAVAADATQTRGYVGAVWSLEKASAIPDVVLGWRRTKTDPSSDVTGYDVSARLRFSGNLEFDSVRAVYLDGDRNRQANAGLGYSIRNRSPFATVGGSVENAKLGVDFMVSPSKLDAFLEINTLGKPAERVAPAPAPAPVVF